MESAASPSPGLALGQHKQPYSLDTVHDGTWFEKLLLNLLSYSLVLVPIAIVVLATKYRLCPGFLQSSALVQLFVNGHYIGSNRQQVNERHSDSENLIVQDNQETKKSSTRRFADQDHTTRRDVLKFLWCFSGLMISYLVWGILQEKIMTTKYNTTHNDISTARLRTPSSNNDESPLVSEAQHISFHDSQFLVFINRIIAFILAIVALVYDRPKRNSSRLLHLTNGKYQVQYRQLSGQGPGGHESSKPSAPLYQFVYCSLSNILSSWCQYEALKYVNFPTQVLSKTFKIVPVMIMSKVLLHKKYKPVDYACALALSMGMFVFLINQPTATTPKHPHLINSTTDGSARWLPDDQNKNGSNPDSTMANFVDVHANSGGSTLFSGLLLLTLYLAFDSFTGNWQKSLFTRYEVTNWQMMAAVNLYSILLTLTSLYQLDNLKPALKMLASSRPLLMDCLLMSVLSSIGQFFVYYTINQFGPVIFTVIMTFRQFLAILISCALYGHHVTAGSGFGILLVFMVVAFQLWHRKATSTKSPGEATGGGGWTKFKQATEASG